MLSKRIKTLKSFQCGIIKIFLRLLLSQPTDNLIRKIDVLLRLIQLKDLLFIFQSKIV